MTIILNSIANIFPVYNNPAQVITDFIQNFFPSNTKNCVDMANIYS